MTLPTPSAFKPHSLGHTFEDADVTVFFGNSLSQPESVQSAFPDFQMIALKQTHSDVIVRSPYKGYAEGHAPEADAHYTDQKRLALRIRTADCMPVMIHDPESGLVASIHAGWRGIENEIITKTAAELARTSGSSLKRARVWIGPHIGPTSFEVNQDVAHKLEARFDAVRGFSGESTALIPHANPEKYFVNLLHIARAQLRSWGFEPERTTELIIDTVSSAAHESHRRDKEKAGRQISFIALK